MAAAQGWDLAFAKAKRIKDAVGIAALGAFACALALASYLLLRAGFSHVSDDDFARTVIAQEWVASLRGHRFLHELPSFREQRWVRIVDPSGTSWLPFPFWVTGTAMAMFGRSIEVARATQMLMLAGATVLLGRALRRAKLGWLAVACILTLGFANPYALWLGASQTPDAWVAVLIASALVSLGEDEPDRYAACALLAATLSRYEAWPVALVFALRFLLFRKPRLAAARSWPALLPLLGPVCWMAWNALAHGAPLHFFTRVSSYRHAHEPLPLFERLAFVPRASLDLFGLGLGALVLIGLVLVLRTPNLRRRWGVSLLGAAALLAFLLLGSLGDGAPTHHAARAQLGLSWLGAAMLWLGLEQAMLRSQVRWGSKAGAILVSLVGFAGILWAAALPSRVRDYPGRDEASRSVQIARGAEAASRAAPITVVPCRYEHLALLAAYGAPEQARIEAADVALATCPQLRYP